MKPKLLDLFCGAGGCARGFQRSGFYVVGVDIAAQPRYAGDEFIQADALDVLRRLLAGERVGGYMLSDFAAIHASPPCQAYTHARHLGHRGRSDHPRLIEPTRDLLRRTGLPYVIENVPGAPLLEALVLCGPSLGLNVKRHRLFESNVAMMAPPCACGRHRPRLFSSTPRHDGSRPLSAYVNPMASATTHDEFAEAMGIDWIPTAGQRPAGALREAVPPAYTEHIGHYLMAEVRARAEAAA